MSDFEAFTSSKKYEQLIDLFYQKMCQIQSFQNQFFSNNCLNLILSNEEVEKILMENDQNKLLLWIEQEIRVLNKIMTRTEERDQERAKGVLLLNVKIILSHKIESLFQYWRGLEKFNWRSLEANYENMSYRSLVEIINYSSSDYMISK